MLLVFFFMPNAHKMDTSEYDTIVKYLKVFLAFMLGMFMNNSLARWWVTVNTVTDSFNGVEKLVYCANSFGVAQARRTEIIRYCIVSCYCLRTEVLNAWTKDEDELVRQWTRAFNKLHKSGYLSDDEVGSLIASAPSPSS